MTIRESLDIGWRTGPFTTAALMAAALLGAAVAIRFAGVAAGAVLLAGVALAAAACWHEGWLDGPGIHLRSLRSALRLRTVHAHSIDRLTFRRTAGPARLRLRSGPDGVELLACGPAPRVPAFRQVAMWLIVHGRREARIDPALLDALAGMPDHASTGQPHDASHA